MPTPRLAGPRIAYTVAAATLLIVAAGSLTVARVAVIGLAALALAAAVHRFVSPQAKALAIRRRSYDIAVLVTFAAVLGYLGLTTPLG